MRARLVVMLIVVGGCSNTAATYERCGNGVACSSPLSCITVGTGYGEFGICTESCGGSTGVSQCPSGGLCVHVGGGASGFCLASCTSSRTCPPNQGCEPVPGSTTDFACFPLGGDPPAASYQSCNVTSGCAVAGDHCVLFDDPVGPQGACLPSCTGRGDTSCPLDRYGEPGVCVQLGASTSWQCVQSCAVDGFCDADLSCSVGTHLCASPDGAHSQPTYATCHNDDCAVSTDQCVAHVSMEFCSSPCSGGFCPTDAAGRPGLCTSLPGYTAVCVQRCQLDADCTANVPTSRCDPDTLACVPAGVPNEAYTNCSDTSIVHCAPAVPCTTIANGPRTSQLCTMRCTSDALCPGGAANARCVVLDGQSIGTCVARCYATGACATGTTCTSHTAAGTVIAGNVCLP
jgi:hypothetical protein